MPRLLTLLLIPLLSLSQTYADDDLFGDDDAATVRGDILEARGELAEGLGRGALLRSLSAKQLQNAIDKRLSNREERVEMYYDLKDMREEELEEDRLSASKRREIQRDSAPDRLNENQINRETGEIYWPSPLDSPALKPYRRPIEETLAKRSESGAVYREFDFLKVHRMIKRIEEAVESIEDRLDVREVVALKSYLDQIDYEARFNNDGERVDY
ncbi:hypothetical protein LF1_40230 [Rubripirellula obstinata]|uniref:Uncharacterized protein n=1 Tax=Rubripirellula obstinata TaxID=406547 RepID=A0A5B1CQ16_9BACT|nr:hypothetical protein [Rubripirellula obstinata]KAA1261473.1 hypothetical protein LF1_40230 [Rubripirellula obstinata]